MLALRMKLNGRDTCLSLPEIQFSRFVKISLVVLSMSQGGFAFVLRNVSCRGPSPAPVCFAQAVTPFVLRSDEESFQSPDGSDKDKDQLSRPERKALERAKKQHRSNLNHRKHNFAGRTNELQSRRQPGEGRYDLHSQVLSSLNEKSSANDVMRAIKRAQNLHDAHDLRAIERFLLEQTDDSFAYGFRGSLLARLTVAALHMNNHELALKALKERRTKHKESILPLESAAIIRGLLRVHNTTDAQQILQEELSLPELAVANVTGNKDIIKYRALSLASIVSRHFFEGEPSEAILACSQLAKMEEWVKEACLTASDLGMPWLRLVQGASRCESGLRNGSITASSDVKVNLPCNLVYAVLEAMSAFPSDNDDQLFEALSNALVRRVLFVAGAVAMDGCPPADRGEAAFIGRSNVGKSSLVNMVTNRKSLAFTSKRPGKTQQFNFFAVNDKPGKEKEIKYGDVVERDKDDDSLYLVDLPGFGFAKVPQETRQQWASFMREYIANRRSLRVLFHLVDARHGLIDEDTTIMKQVAESLRPGVSYVVVLTKADKNVNGASSKNLGKVSRDILNKLHETMVACGVGNAPVVLTSAETKLGRDQIWRHLRRAAEF